MITTSFILLLFMTALAVKKQHNAPFVTNGYSQHDRSGKHYSEELSRNITDKINENHLLMSHILLKQSLSGIHTEADFFDRDFTGEGKDDILKKILMSALHKDIDGYGNSNDKKENIYVNGRKHINNGNYNGMERYGKKMPSQAAIDNRNQNPVFFPIVIPRPIPLHMPHLLPMNNPFGTAMMFQRSPLNFPIPQLIGKTSPTE